MTDQIEAQLRQSAARRTGGWWERGDDATQSARAILDAALRMVDNEEPVSVSRAIQVVKDNTGIGLTQNTVRSYCRSVHGRQGWLK